VLHSRNKIRRAPCVDTHVPSWHVVDYNPRIRAVQRRGIRNLRIVQLEVVVPEALKPVEIAKSVRKTSGWHARFLRYLPPLANVVRTRDAVAESLKSEALLRTHEKLVTWFDVTQDRLAGTMQVSFFQNKKKKKPILRSLPPMAVTSIGWTNTAFIVHRCRLLVDTGCFLSAPTLLVPILQRSMLSFQHSEVNEKAHRALARLEVPEEPQVVSGSHWHMTRTGHLDTLSRAMRGREIGLRRSWSSTFRLGGRGPATLLQERHPCTWTRSKSQQDARAASDRLPRCVALPPVLGNAHLSVPAARGTGVNRSRRCAVGS